VGCTLSKARRVMCLIRGPVGDAPHPLPGGQCALSKAWWAISLI
jgi:hypothetical protein